MAINVVGFDGTMTEAQWAKLVLAIGTVGYKHGVVSGFDVTPGGGARQTAVSAGELLLPGLRVESTSTVTLTHAANPGSSARTDVIVARADWAANTVTIAIVQGTSSTPPALTQVAGTTWEMPLAQVSVPAGYNAAFTNTHIATNKPVRLPLTPIRGTLDLSQTVASNGTAKTICTIEVPDPGRAFYLRVTAAVEFDSKNSGYGRLAAELADGTRLETAQSPRLSNGGATAQLVGRPSLVLTGKQTVSIKVVANLMNSGDGPLSMPTTGASSLNFATVEQIPA